MYIYPIVETIERVLVLVLVMVSGGGIYCWKIGSDVMVLLCCIYFSICLHGPKFIPN